MLLDKIIFISILCQKFGFGEGGNVCVIMYRFCIVLKLTYL